jgi:hypothetical protein
MLSLHCQQHDDNFLNSSDLQQFDVNQRTKTKDTGDSHSFIHSTIVFEFHTSGSESSFGGSIVMSGSSAFCGLGAALVDDAGGAPLFDDTAGCGDGSGPYFTTRSEINASSRPRYTDITLSMLAALAIAYTL